MMDVVGVVDIEARLERLTSQGLLDHVSAAPEPEYEFRHALIHDAAYASLRRQDRRRLHLRVADALERVHPERADLAGTLAHHLMRAGSPTRALPHLISAGDQAAAIFANREAAGHYQSALDLVAAGAVGQETERARLDAMLHEKLGDLWEALGDHTAAIASFEAAGSGPGDGDPIRRARLWRKVGVSRLGARELPEALAALEHAATLLDRSPGPHAAGWWTEWVQLQLDRAWTLYFAAHTGALEDHLAAVRELIEQHGTPAQLAAFHACVSRHGILRDRGHPGDDVLSSARTALMMGREAGDLRQLASHHFHLGLVHLLRHVLRPAIREFERSLPLADRTDDSTVRLRCLTYLPVATRLSGDVERTAELAARALEEARIVDARDYVGAALGNLAWVALRRGRPDETLRLGDEAWATWESVPFRYPLRWLAVLPMMAVAVGREDWPAAVGWARTLVEHDQYGLDRRVEMLLPAVLERWDSGREREAQDGVTELLAMARATGHA